MPGTRRTSQGDQRPASSKEAEKNPDPKATSKPTYVDLGEMTADAFLKAGKEAVAELKRRKKKP